MPGAARAVGGPSGPNLKAERLKAAHWAGLPQGQGAAEAGDSDGGGSPEVDAAQRGQVREEAAGVGDAGVAQGIVAARGPRTTRKRDDQCWCVCVGIAGGCQGVMLTGQTGGVCG